MALTAAEQIALGMQREDIEGEKDDPGHGDANNVEPETNWKHSGDGTRAS